jgi:hypothetical protein
VFQEYLFNRLDRELEVLSSLTLADVLLYIRHQFIPLAKHPLIQEFMKYNILYLKISYGITTGALGRWRLEKEGES